MSETPDLRVPIRPDGASRLRRWLSLGAVGVLAAAWPRDVLVTPAMSVEVVDRGGAPVAGVAVVRSSADGGRARAGASEHAATDGRGRAYFTARWSRASRASEWAAAADWVGASGRDGAGPRSWIVVALPEGGPSGVVLSPDRAEDGMASWRCVVGVGCTPVR